MGPSYLESLKISSYFLNMKNECILCGASCERRYHHDNSTRSFFKCKECNLFYGFTNTGAAIKLPEDLKNMIRVKIQICNTKFNEIPVFNSLGIRLPNPLIISAWDRMLSC